MHILTMMCNATVPHLAGGDSQHAYDARCDTVPSHVHHAAGRQCVFVLKQH